MVNNVTRTALPTTLSYVAGSSAVGGGTQTVPVTRTAALALSGDMLADASASTSAGASLGNLLPDTTEQATSTATDNSNQVQLMGQTVGASLAEAGGTVDWRDFTSQAKADLMAAGYSSADIKTYLGAVKQTYQQFQALPPSVASVTTTAASSAAQLLPDSTDDGWTFGDDDGSTDSIPGTFTDGTNGTTPQDGVTATPGAVSTAAVMIDPSQLPSMDLPASSFAELAQQAYGNGWSAQGDSVDIDELVANTQNEMDNMGYSTDQVDNYMIGLFQAYNAVAEPPASAGTPDATPDNTDNGDGGTTPYDPDPPYDPLLNGDNGY